MTSSRLADYCSSIDYGYTASARDQPPGPRFLRITDIVSGPPQWDSVPFCDADDRTAEKFKLHDGDIVVARTGATTGVSAYINDPPAAVFASYLVRLKIDLEVADPRFVAYFMKGLQFWGYIRGVLGDKSAQPNASAKTITQAPASFPRLDDQRAIAGVLGALDDKIEQNRRTARALERLARAIFKAWFVDFEPVKAKAEGATSFPSMPQPVFDALPTTFIDTDIGLVPEGWGMKALSGICALVSGGTPKRSEASYWGGSFQWFSVKDAPSDGEIWVIDTAERITDEGLSNSAATLVPKGCTIISARGTIGKLAMAGIPMAFNQSCYGLLPVDKSSYCYLHLLMQAAVAELQRRTHGSVFDTITRATFDGLLVVSPQEETVSSFETVAAPLFDSLLSLIQESAKLAQLRDYLLPRLLSGSVRVGAANG
jgi:type I restriction enzyme S subunit